MLIDSKKQRQLKITLSAVEICDYFGSFEDIRYDSARARAALGSILLHAMESSDFRLSSGKLSIKVYPTQSGGCDIYFILSSAKRLRRTEKHYIYEFYSCEDMLSACEQIKLHSTGDIALSLYRKDGRYRVLIGGKDMCRRLLLIGTEYAARVITERFAASKTKEHWHRICDNTPVSKIII